MNSILQSHLEKIFGRQEVYPGSWQQKLHILEAYSFTQKAEDVASFFNIKASDVELLVKKKDWEKELGKLRTRLKKDLVEQNKLILLSYLADNPSKSQDKILMAVQKLEQIEWEPLEDEGETRRQDGVDFTDPEQVKAYVKAVEEVPLDPRT
jgi:hypothetical protein